jgi:PAS domain S-box-containing protein
MQNKTKILLVEDESIVAIDLKRTLQNLNYEVVDVARTGEKAVQIAVEKEPDLILMDIMLAGTMTGTDAAMEIRKQKDIPVIYITAYADNTTLSQAKLTQPSGYIIKPFDDKNLLSTIEMALYKDKLDKKLKESEKAYRRLVEKSPVAIGILSGRHIVYANPFAVKLFGAKNEEELKKKYIFDFIHSEYASLIKEKMQKILKEGETIDSVNEKLRTLDGRIIDVEFTALPTIYQDKPAIQIVIRDITEINKKEKIQQATLRILQASDSSTSISELYDRFHKILAESIRVNNLVFVFFDHDSDLLKCPYGVDEFHPIFKERKPGKGLPEYIISKGTIQLLNADEINGLINSGIISDDPPCPKSLLGIPFHLYDNKSVVMIIKEYHEENLFGEKEKEFMKNIIFPISRSIEKKQIEEESKKYTDELKRLNSTKDKFLSLVSHDLKSPFNSLMGYTEILKNEFQELSVEERELFINSIYESTRYVYNLLNDLLEFSKFYLGLIKIELHEINIRKLIDENISFLTTLAKRKNISLLSEISENYIVLAEDDMINSVVRNLITNAVKFTNQNGKIRIYAEVDGSKLKISVADDGIGMDEETRENLFNLVSKKAHPGTANEEGTGLGLILTKEFVEKNNGEIFVDSEPGKGTTFTFSLQFVRII